MNDSREVRAAMPDPVRDPPDAHGGRCWPTREQELLLRAALLHGPAVHDAWARWREVADIDRLDRGSMRLLPELYRNLLHEGVRGPELGRLKGVYRQTWYKNQLVFRDMVGILSELHAAGVPIMVVKGAALILRYHHDFGARPMDDFDIVVPYGRAARALEVLREHGWASNDPLSEYRMRAFNGMNMHDGEGRQLDLHWHLLAEDCRLDADADFWADADALDLHGTSVLILHPSDQLLHVCVHGLRWNEVPPIRWIADAVHIVELSAQALDWDRVVAGAVRHRVTRPVLHALSYLRALLGMPVPPSVITRLERAPVSLRARLEYHVAVNPRNAWLGSLPEYWLYWMRATDGAGARGRYRGFLSYLREEWRCASGRDLWAQIALRSARRLRGRSSVSSS